MDQMLVSSKEVSLRHNCGRIVMYYDVSTCHVYLQILRASTSPEKFIELRYRNRLRQANGTTGSLSARPKREFEASLGMEVGYCR